MAGDWDDEQRAALVALLQTRPAGMRWDVMCQRVAQTHDPIALLKRPGGATLFGESTADEAMEAAYLDIQRWQSGPFRMLTFLDDEYPDRLRSVHQMPPIVFVQGQLVAGDRGVSVVGSRQASPRAVAYARAVSRMLVQSAITVVAGLAEGVDTVAHRTALEAGGRTVAVLGCGLEHAYPPSNRELQGRIGRDGLLLSQFMPCFAPRRWSFPLRNATMSAYGYATIIAEAGEHSGTRIQAREAIGHGRPVIIDESVVVGTTWGRELVDRPGVHVATSPRNAVEHVMTVLALEEQVVQFIALT